MTSKSLTSNGWVFLFIAAIQILKKAESLYWDYSTNSLDDIEKEELINDLFNEVLEEKEPM
jgi:hypothetical protein